MISALLPLALAFTAATPFDGDAPESRSPRPAVAAVLVDEHAFRAFNATPVDRMILVGEHGQPAVAALYLPAGAEVFLPLHPGTTAGLEIELVTLAPRHVGRSGPISIDLAATGGAPIAVVSADEHACAWTVAASSAGYSAGAALAAEGAPVAVTAMSTCNAAAMLVLHVPLVVPIHGDAPPHPPELDPDPLPAF